MHGIVVRQQSIYLVNYFIIIFIEDVVSLIFIIKVKIKYKIFKQLFY